MDQVVVRAKEMKRLSGNKRPSSCQGIRDKVVVRSKGTTLLSR